MLVYDDKTSTAIKSGSQLLISGVQCQEDITFKASYNISSGIKCDGKITALFDLIVYGDVQANEIDVKGRFVCTGHCTVSGAIMVHNDMWCEYVQASSIVCHDRIVAQEINATTISAEGSIIIGKTLAVENEAKTNQIIMCGETVYGAGKIVASSILTVEPLDLDDGEEALESPYKYSPKENSCITTEVSKESVKYSKSNDYIGFISKLIETSDATSQKRLEKYKYVLDALESATLSSIYKIQDASLLIWLIEMSQSEYFKEWHTVSEWTKAVLKHFQDMAEGKVTGLIQGKPAENLLKGYTVTHAKYGLGVVSAVIASGMGTAKSKTVVINFEEFGVKKFPIPESLAAFQVLGEKPDLVREEIKNSITCKIDSYEELLSALYVINNNKEFLGECLHNILFKLLVGKLGLKAAFIEKRFIEMGWD